MVWEELSGVEIGKNSNGYIVLEFYSWDVMSGEAESVALRFFYALLQSSCSDSDWIPPFALFDSWTKSKRFAISELLRDIVYVLAENLSRLHNSFCRGLYNYCIRAAQRLGMLTMRLRHS